jgi:glycosyltransferase involved in cell wall biosynthesis
MNWCVVIPTYNNEKTLEKVVRDVLAVCDDVIVVNDGSTDSTADILSHFPKLQVISYAPNRGKGYALRKGFELAFCRKYQHVITIDSDGQHYASDITQFVAGMKENPDALIMGYRTLPMERMRQGSGFANRLSNFWFRLITGISLPDTQSGFRLYPLHLLQNMRFYTRRYEFELEILVRSAWKGIPVTSIPISVYYPSPGERISHYRPIKDFLRISLLNTIFVFIAFFFIKPFSFIKYLKKEHIREFLLRNILHSDDSTTKITLSVMFGVFMGIVPIWGYQLITAIALSYVLKLNKLIVIVAANISIPPMIPVILYLSLLTGSITLGTSTHLSMNYLLTFDYIKTNLYQYIVGSIIFALILAVIMGLIMFIILKIIRRNRITNR